MKKLYIFIATLVFTVFGVQAQLGTDVFTLGEDDSSNYPGASWTTTNQGTGFSDWTFDNGGGGFTGRFIGSFSTALDVSGTSFGLFANSNPGAFSGAAVDMPQTMQEGDSFTVSVGVNFRDGNKGFDLRNSSNSTIINFNVGSDQYNLTGTSGLFSNAYDANTVFTFTFTQNASDVSWEVVRSGGLSGTQTGTIGSISPGTIENIRFYNTSAGFNGDGGSGQRNLYLNSLDFESTYTIAENSTISSSGDITVPYLDVQSGSTLNIPSNSNVTVSGDLNNSGTLNISSTSTQFPSLIVNGSSTGNITYNRFVNSNILGNDLVAPPVDGQTWSSFLNPVNATALLDNGAVPTATYAFGPFDKTVGEYVNYTGATSATLNAGQGYRAATDLGETLAFTGTVETGTVAVDIQNSGPTEQEWNLVGNPYPSYLNVQAFLNHEVSPGVSNISLFDSGTEAIYGYDGNAANGWTVYNLGTTTPSTVIAPGQGFYVSANDTDDDVYDLEFTSAMRSTGTSDDFIAGRGGALVFCTLMISTENNDYSTDFYFNPSSLVTLGFDQFFDTEFFATPPPFSLYSLLVEETPGEEGTPYTVQIVNATDLADVTFPLGVNAFQSEQLTFSISVNNLPSTADIFLEDTVEGVITQLDSGDYTITPTSDLSGTGRFFLRVTDDTLSLADSNLDGLLIYSVNDTNEILVKGQLQGTSELSLYDIQGRKILTSALDNTVQNNRIDVSNLNAGVYIATVNDGVNQKSQKVIIK